VADEERDLTAWLGNELQDDAFENLYAMSERVRLMTIQIFSATGVTFKRVTISIINVLNGSAMEMYTNTSILMIRPTRLSLII